jgi:hypothetical protein
VVSHDSPLYFTAESLSKIVNISANSKPNSKQFKWFIRAPGGVVLWKETILPPLFQEHYASDILAPLQKFICIVGISFLKMYDSALLYVIQNN